MPSAGRHAAAPPTVYRALDFLLANGCIHKLESINAFVACHHPKAAQHSVPFLICDRCHSATELEDFELLQDFRVNDVGRELVGEVGVAEAEMRDLREVLCVEDVLQGIAIDVAAVIVVRLPDVENELLEVRQCAVDNRFDVRSLKATGFNLQGAE